MFADRAERRADLARRHRLLFWRKTPVAIRRRPADVAEWPESTRIFVPVDLTRGPVAA